MQSELQEKIKRFILDEGVADRKLTEDAFAEAQKTIKKFSDVLIEKKIIPEEKVMKISAYVLGVPFIDLIDEEIAKDVLMVIPEPIAKEHSIIAFKKRGSELFVAMLDPEDLQTIEFIKKKTGLKISASLTTRESIKNSLKQYQKSLEAEFEDLINKGSLKGGLKIIEEGEEEQSGDLEKKAYDMPVVKIVDTLLSHAISEGASDIHIEPEEKDVLVRYRVDGVLKKAMILPKAVHQGIIARIKVLANLKLDEHRLPQDGRFKIEGEDYKMAFRVSVLPIFDGEKIVMRLLNENMHGLSLEKIGFWGKAYDNLKEEIAKPNGIILVTGPTGSGKTTTLYSILEILNTPDVNINTIEDPIEYRMPHVNQTQVHVKVGLTFAAGLRSLLRQDPDIIMVGEIRDEETAEMAIHAALTGHLVLSTLHTNSAAATIPRLIDMKIEPFLIATTINVIIAQRLVRRLCPECRKPYHLDKDALNNLSKKIDLEKILNIVNKEKIANVKKWENHVFYKPEGCDRCQKEGYKGRVGVYEVLKSNEAIRVMVNKGSNADLIQKQAVGDGMLTMLEDGFVKFVQGITSIEEVLRVTQE
ncbi:Flp pilus assembly complex ATPase component TadA [Patescibacteria group bacterium]|nr:Flp pilus assembly complex ATPase component TadA [Patescibacteria group bacterium]